MGQRWCAVEQADLDGQGFGGCHITRRCQLFPAPQFRQGEIADIQGGPVTKGNPGYFLAVALETPELYFLPPRQQFE